MRKTNLAVDCAEGETLLPVDEAFAAITGEATIIAECERVPVEIPHAPGRTEMVPAGIVGFEGDVAASAATATALVTAASVSCSFPG